VPDLTTVFLRCQFVTTLPSRHSFSTQPAKIGTACYLPNSIPLVLPSLFCTLPKHPIQPLCLIQHHNLNLPKHPIQPLCLIQHHNLNLQNAMTSLPPPESTTSKSPSFLCILPSQSSLPFVPDPIQFLMTTCAHDSLQIQRHTLLSWSPPWNFTLSYLCRPPCQSTLASYWTLHRTPHAAASGFHYAPEHSIMIMLLGRSQSMMIMLLGR